MHYCFVTQISFTLSSRPLAKTQVFNHQLQSHEFDVVAMYSYPGQEQGDLALVKGQKYIVFDDARPHWWRARDERG